MSTKESLSALRGVPTITTDEGVVLGVVEHIYLDPETKKLSAIGLNPRAGGDTAYVRAADIALIGHDVFLVPSGKVLQPASETQDLGRRLRKLRGLPVITEVGVQLGKLEDLDVDRQGLLEELHLSEYRSLAVDPDEVSLGSDAIVVPAACLDRVAQQPEREGFFARVRSWTHRGGEDAVAKTKSESKASKKNS